MLVLRNFFIALSFPIIGIGVIFLHLNFIASSEANPKSLTVDDLKQMLAMHKQIAAEQLEQAKVKSPYGCDDIENAISTANLDIKRRDDDGAYVVFPLEKTHDVFYVVCHPLEEGIGVVLVTAIDAPDRVKGLIVANMWNEDINASTAFYQQEENMIVQRTQFLAVSQKGLVEKLNQYIVEIDDLEIELNKYVQWAERDPT